MEQRHPYLTLGLPYGVDRKAAAGAYARALRRVGTSEFPFSREDLNWALHQIEQDIPDPQTHLSYLRVPAVPEAFQSSGDGIVVPGIRPIDRSTTSRPAEHIQRAEQTAFEALRRSLAGTASTLIPQAERPASPPTLPPAAPAPPAPPRASDRRVDLSPPPRGRRTTKRFALLATLVLVLGVVTASQIFSGESALQQATSDLAPVEDANGAAPDETETEPEPEPEPEGEIETEPPMVEPVEPMGDAEAPVDAASRSLTPADFLGEQDLSWSTCDPAWQGTEDHEVSSVVDVAPDGSWVVYWDGDDFPVWSGAVDALEFGDVTGNGFDEALVVVSCTSGASASPWDLAVFTSDGDDVAPLAILDVGLAQHYGRTLVHVFEGINDGTVVYEVLQSDDDLETGFVHRYRVAQRWDGTSFRAEEDHLGVESFW
jgi:hypothetical protein